MTLVTDCESDICKLVYLCVVDNISFLHKIPEQDGKLHAYSIYGIFKKCLMIDTVIQIICV